MAFFDNLGAKMSQVGQKTKDFTEINRLKGLISDEERGIGKLKAQIGEAYLALHADDPEEGMAELVGAVKAAQEKIADYQTQIKGLRGVKQCPACGADVEPGVQFCKACGAAMPQPEPPAPPAGAVVCPACGAQVPEGAKFCKACGAPVPKPEPPAPPAAGAVCPVCGAQAPEGSKFCRACGAPMTPPAPPAPEQAVCPACGAPVQPGVLFCANCGQKL